MGEIKWLNENGDSKFIWDPNIEAEIQAAEAQYDTLIDQGYKAYKVGKSGKKGKEIDAFDPDLGKIIMVPKLVGG
jgi:hypothetical protein